MDIKGTSTEKNLMAAFQGESMARNKYLFFAERAREENHNEIAELFESLATNEGMHGKLLYQKLKGVDTTSKNLQTAANGEYGEWHSMYPKFAEEARKEGFEDIAKLFENIAKIEKDHEYRFMKALMTLMSGSNNKYTSKTEIDKTEEVKKTTIVSGYRCMFCGAVFEERPDVCPVCEAIGSFEETKIKKDL